VARTRDNRLARLAADTANDDAVKDRDRCMPRAWKTVCTIVRNELMQSGVDPAQVPALRLGEARDLPNWAAPTRNSTYPVAIVWRACSLRRSAATHSGTRTGTSPILPMLRSRNYLPGLWYATTTRPGVPYEPPGSEDGGSTAAGGAVDESEDLGAFTGTVGRQPMPVAAIPHIGEEAGAVLMKMQEGPALEIKDPGPPLDEQHSHAKAFEQIRQRLERDCTSVLHQSFPVHSEGSHPTRPVVRLKHSVPVAASARTARLYDASALSVVPWAFAGMTGEPRCGVPSVRLYSLG